MALPSLGKKSSPISGLPSRWGSIHTGWANPAPGLFKTVTHQACCAQPFVLNPERLFIVETPPPPTGRDGCTSLWCVQVMAIATLMKQEFDATRSLSGIGGVETGRDAAEFLLLGASTVQVYGSQTIADSRCVEPVLSCAADSLL